MNETLIMVFTGVVAGSTVLYMLITGWLAIENRKMRLAQTEPKVSVQLELNDQIGHGGMQLAIRNEGMGPAESITFEFEGNPDLFTSNGMPTPINEVPVIKDGLKYLGSGRQFTFTLGWLFGEAFEQAKEHPWIFHVKYKNQTGQLRSDSYVLHFSQFSHLMIGEGDPLRKIANSLESIKKELGFWGTGFHKLQVVTQPKHTRTPTPRQQSKEEFESQMSHLGIPVEYVDVDADSADPEEGESE